MHVTVDLLLMVIDGQLPPAVLVRVLHEHLLEICDECRREWEAYSHGHDSPFAFTGRSAPLFRPLPEDPDEWTLEDIGAYERLVQRIQEVSRVARDEIAELQTLPPEDWIPHVEAHPGRFDSRALAEHLLEASRDSLPEDPRKAHHLAVLVPTVLDRIPDAATAPWCTDLHASALAHRAEALRHTGDLAQADSLFTTLRHTLRTRPLSSPALSAQITTLEAALRESQGRTAEALTLRTQAEVARRVADSEAAVNTFT